jgi:acyl-homoserine-lactone acylase
MRLILIDFEQRDDMIFKQPTPSFSKQPAVLAISPTNTFSQTSFIWKSILAFSFIIGANISSAQAQTPPSAKELKRWQATAQNITISRDKWGIPHVVGKSDADAVFGLLYAQAEDDFHRIELNYINAMGRLAEVEGEAEIWRDLRMKLFIQTPDLKKQYARSPAWLQQLMVGFADGLNYYLHTHPEVKPRLITHFEPWMALAFSEGSIGGDIESINLQQLEALYAQAPSIADNKLSLNVGTLLASHSPVETTVKLPEPSGSNGFAIAPSRTANGQAMLLINPHTSFYFRPEVHMTSSQGLNAYGAVTWGQFFIYQGFNQYNGWMHTSNAADVIDEYALTVSQTVSQKNQKFSYLFEGKQRPLRAIVHNIPYKTKDGMATRKITAYYSHQGPVVRAADGKWITVALMNEPKTALMQSYLRTKTKDYASFAKVMELRANSSNNTVYADSSGNIAYFHGDFVPRRNDQFDFTKPVDGSLRATDWNGLHPVKEIIQLFNPKNGWIQNTNNWPFSAAGEASPRIENFPRYMWTTPENARGLHAVKVLKDAKDLTIDGLIKLAYDSELTAFESLLPPLFKAYDATPDANLAEQIAALRTWNLRASTDSIPTSLAIYWAQDLVQHHAKQARASNTPIVDFLPTVAASDLLAALNRASQRLQSDFGNWQTPWGEINRFQRLSGDVHAGFDDSKPSWPVAFASGNWGALASFGMTAKQTTKRIYGDRGNSFVAAVSFGPRVTAKSILAGGQSSNPSSPHFNDQGEMYSKGQFKDVLFYPEDIERNLERKYQPGK